MSVCTCVFFKILVLVSNPLGSLKLGPGRVCTHLNFLVCLYIWWLITLHMKSIFRPILEIERSYLRKKTIVCEFSCKNDYRQFTSKSRRWNYLIFCSYRTLGRLFCWCRVCMLSQRRMYCVCRRKYANLLERVNTPAAMSPVSWHFWMGLIRVCLHACIPRLKSV